MTANPREALERGDALLVVDVQNDFCPGGALPVPEGDAVIPILNEWAAAAAEKGALVYASRDWHPKGHISFEEKGGPWPPHCVQDTEGAAYHPNLRLPESAVKVTKGVRFDQDQNSAFDQTGLATAMKAEGIERLWIGGLAQDVCVLASALDARKAGFEVHLLAPATRAITEESGADAIKQMRDAGVIIEA